jgi:hypothetical protein
VATLEPISRADLESDEIAWANGGFERNGNDRSSGNLSVPRSEAKDGLPLNVDFHVPV